MMNLKLDFDYKLLESYVKLKPFMNLMREYINNDAIRRMMTERELEVFNEYYFTEKTFDEIGKEKGFTRERIRQLLEKGNRRLKIRLSQINKFLSLKEDELEIKKLQKENYNLKNANKLLLNMCECGKRKEIESVIFANQYTPHQLSILDKKLVDLDFSVRALNCLKAADVETVAQLIEFKLSDFMKFRNFGKKSLIGIKEFLDIHGFKIQS